MLPRTLFFLLALLAASAAGSESPAPEPPQASLTLAGALSRVLRQSPELQAYSWEIRAAEARLIQAKLRPNPEVNLTTEDVTGSGEYRDGGQAQRTLQLSQLVELGSKRQARVDEANHGRALAELDYQVKRVEILRETTEAFVDGMLAQRRLELSEEALGLAEKAVPITERRVEVGKASKVEVTRGSVAVALAQIGRDQASRDLLAAKARLAAMWGETKQVFVARLSGDFDDLAETSSFRALTSRLSGNPQLARWTVERHRREAALRAARAQATPDVTAFAGPRVIGKGDEVSTGVVGFSMPLPLFHHNQGNIAEAQAMLAKAVPEQRAAEAKAFAELTVAYQSLLRASEEVTVLKTTVLPGATQTVELLSAGYEAGRFGQLEILEARRTLHTAREQYLRALADRHKALAQVEALTARPVELTGSEKAHRASPPKPTPAGGQKRPR